MREESERELNEKENAMRLMREQKDREIADLRNKLFQASLVGTPPPPPQVNHKFVTFSSFRLT